MNRVIANGLLFDAAVLYRHILYVQEHRQIRKDFDELARHVEHGWWGSEVSIRRTNGYERIDFATGGRILFVPASRLGSRVRGLLFDLVYLATEAGLEHVLPLVACKKDGEVIRAWA